MVTGPQSDRFNILPHNAFSSQLISVTENSDIRKFIKCSLALLMKICPSQGSRVCGGDKENVDKTVPYNWGWGVQPGT